MRVRLPACCASKGDTALASGWQMEHVMNSRTLELVRLSKLACASLICGCLSLPLAIVGVASASIPVLIVALLVFVAAIVLGLLGWRAVRRSDELLCGSWLGGLGIAIPSAVMFFALLILPNI